MKGVSKHLLAKGYKKPRKIFTFAGFFVGIFLK